MPADTLDEHGLPSWPAAERNKQPILEVLRRVLPERGTLLEIASGTGQHAAHFAAGLAGWTIQPSDRDPEHLETLGRRVALAENERLLPPIALDVTQAPPALSPTAIYCANMLHIAPWAACVGLFTVAHRLLGAGGLLVTYGPYSLHGEQTSESNAAFDLSLKARNPDWGVRDVDELSATAREQAFELTETCPMPANNLLLVWRHRGAER
jgi:Protein of unknown function (DUF938)